MTRAPSGTPGYTSLSILFVAILITSTLTPLSEAIAAKLKAGASGALNAPAAGLMTIEGTVLDDNGQFVANATLRLSPGNKPAALSDNRGSFRFVGVGPGSYQVRVSANGMFFSPDTQTVTVSTRAPQPLTFNGERLLTVTGHVRNRSNAAVPGVPGVTLDIRHESGSSQRATTDNQGGFRLSGVRPGRYTVIPQKKGFSFDPAQPNFDLPRDGLDWTILGFPGSVTLAGRIIGPDRRGVANIEVRIRQQAAVGGAPIDQRVRSDNSGNFRLPGIAAASGRFSIEPAGLGITFQPPRIEEGVGEWNVTGIDFTASRTVPNLIGQKETDAIRELRQNGFTHRVVDHVLADRCQSINALGRAAASMIGGGNDDPLDKVESQEPRASQIIHPDAEVAITVARANPQLVMVPALETQPERTASDTLRGLGLRAVVQNRPVAVNTPAARAAAALRQREFGTVIEQQPTARECLRQGGDVRLTVLQEPPPQPVPSVVNSPWQQAGDRLKAANLTPRIKEYLTYHIDQSGKATLGGAMMGGLMGNGFRPAEHGQCRDHGSVAIQYPPANARASVLEPVDLSVCFDTEQQVERGNIKMNLLTVMTANGWPRPGSAY